MEGVITITDERGGLILVANIWTVILVQGFPHVLRLLTENMRVYIDGSEIDKPEVFKDET